MWYNFQIFVHSAALSLLMISNNSVMVRAQCMTAIFLNTEACCVTYSLVYLGEGLLHMCLLQSLSGCPMYVSYRCLIRLESSLSV